MRTLPGPNVRSPWWACSVQAALSVLTAAVSADVLAGVLVEVFVEVLEEVPVPVAVLLAALSVWVSRSWPACTSVVVATGPASAGPFEGPGSSVSMGLSSVNCRVLALPNVAPGTICRAW